MISKHIAKFAGSFRSTVKIDGNKSEPVLVEKVTKALNGLDDDNGKIHIRTLSKFIHGAASMVKTDTLIGRKRELGDMIFIVTLVLNGKPEFERITINQCKKSEKGKMLNWKIAKEQLLLLAKFPSFTAQGSFPGKGRHCSWKDFSGCLGSYGLFDEVDSEFRFLSATRIHQYLCLHKKLLGGRKSSAAEYFKIDKQGDLLQISEKCMNCNRWFLPGRHEDLHNLCENGIDLCVARPCPNQHFAKDIDDFSNKYLTLQIGEPTIAFGRIVNPKLAKVAEELKTLLDAPQDTPSRPFPKSKKTRKDMPEEGKGIGIIYTIIDVNGDDVPDMRKGDNLGEKR